MLNEISIEILSKCPNSCLHCSSYSTNQCADIIDKFAYTKLVDDALLLGLKRVCLSGGEPFLHPDIIELVEYNYKNCLETYIYTSGVTLTQHGAFTAISNNLLATLASKVTKVIFNIEAAEPIIYDKIMGTSGCFDLMKQSIISAVAAGIVTEAHFVPMKINQDQLVPTIALCNNLGISKISFLRLVLHGRAAKHADLIALNDDETHALQQQLMSIQKNAPIECRIGTPFSQEKHQCVAATAKLNIRYDGYVYPCEVFKNKSAELVHGLYPENIREKSIIDIYENSNYLNAVRKEFKVFSAMDTSECCLGQYWLNIKNCLSESRDVATKL